MITELARVQVEAQKLSYEENDLEEYEFIAEPTACPICKAIDGKHFKVAKMLPGENAPPMHPYCRCSTAPYSDRKEFDEWLDGHKDQGMSYVDWRARTAKSQRNIGAKRLKNGAKNGIINIEIDEFVPCLKDNRTGDVLETVVSEVKSRDFLKQYNEKNGWYINWSEVPDDCIVMALRIKGQNEVQRLVAYQYMPKNMTVKGHWMVANPKSNGSLTKNPEYSGIGGHLYAIMAEASMKMGYDGFIEGQAANSKLLKHYVEKFDAKPLGGLRFYINGVAAKKLLDKYNWSEEDEG